MNKCTKKNCPMNAETLNPDCDLKSCQYRTEEISGDSISKEQVINELKLGYFDKDLQSAKDDPCIVDAMIDWAIRIIKRLPPVTPKARWIPVSERLPEDSSNVLITLNPYGIVVPGWYSNKKKMWFRLYQGRWVEVIDAECDVIAWQYFPEPYKEDK